jgi:hypothetical protein
VGADMVSVGLRVCWVSLVTPACNITITATTPPAALSHQRAAHTCVQAEYRRGTATGSSALPRLTLRRVRSVSRWSHNVPGAADGSSAGGGRAAAAAAAEAAAGDEDISPAAQCILSAGVLVMLLLLGLTCSTLLTHHNTNPHSCIQPPPLKLIRLPARAPQRDHV